MKQALEKLIQLRDKAYEEIDDCPFLVSGWVSILGTKGKEYYKSRIQQQFIEQLQQLARFESIQKEILND